MSIAFNLRPYQERLIHDIEAAWASGAANVCAVAPVGAGKTLIMSQIVDRLGGAACLMAHRQELVSQISMALARCGVLHSIIAPKAVVQMICRLHHFELGRQWYDPNSKVRVAGVGTLIRHNPSDPWMRQVSLWVTDECFESGTLVDGKPIESIKVGDYVTAFNEETGALERKEVTRLFKNTAPDTVVKVSVSHHVVHCTLWHPFFTDRGWVPACQLTEEDSVLLHELQPVREAFRPAFDGERYHNEQPKAGLRVLLNRVWQSINLREAKRNSEKEKDSHGNSTMRRMWGYVHRFAVPIPQSPAVIAKLLHERLFLCRSRSKVIGDNAENESEVCLGKDASEQSDAQRGREGKGLRDVETDGTRTKSSRREREAANKSGSCAKQPVWTVRFRESINRQNGGKAWLPPSLQNRLRELLAKDCNRGGRVEPCGNGAETTGREERRVLTWSRVGCIQIFKRTDPERVKSCFRDGFTYNIEVAGLHTYIANGIVVHNCHHLIKGSTFEKCTQLFPHARGLGLTATPTRADGKGLGRHSDGLFDALVVGPTLRELVSQGHLTEYRIFAPPASALDLTVVPTSAGGDWSPEPLRQAVHKAHITGDVVGHYLKHAAGKRGITFAVDIESAGEMAAAFRAAGVPAECVSGKTPDITRAQILRKLRTGDLLQVTNCDLFGEGFDLPAIEVVSMARPTQSFGLFVQQAGRALRLMPGKGRALLIDHVGNVQRHAVARFDEDANRVVVDLCHRAWTLDRRDKRSSAKVNDAIPTRTCPGCTQVYERSLLACPYCGHAVEPAGRSAPDQVDGDLAELDPAALQSLAARVRQVNSTHIVAPKSLSGPALGALNREHAKRLEAQQDLQSAMMLWGGVDRRLGREREAQKEFFLRFGTDVLTAQTLGATEARELAARVRQG